ncbi:3-mercaptopyruvate sulfurtransferase [Mustelus asterias]
MAASRAVVSAAWLSEALSGAQAGTLRVLDCSWHLPKLQRDGRQEFGERHIPGAAFFDLNGCSDPADPPLHMMPGPEHFSRCAGELGISSLTHVVVYDASDFGQFSAPRVWWMFRAFGHSLVSVLDGGFLNWRKEGRPVTSEVQPLPRAEFKANPKAWIKSYQEILDNIQSKQFQLVDARPEGRFRGTQPEPREGIEPGHIPNSINIPFTTFMHPDTLKMKSENEIRHLFEDRKIDLNKPLVVCCGSGVTACMVALGAYLCGKDDVLLYDGAWTEWFRRADRSNIISEKK